MGSGLSYLREPECQRQAPQHRAAAPCGGSAGCPVGTSLMPAEGGGVGDGSGLAWVGVRPSRRSVHFRSGRGSTSRPRCTSASLTWRPWPSATERAPWRPHFAPHSPPRPSSPPRPEQPGRGLCPAAHPAPRTGHGVWDFTVFISNKKGTGFVNEQGSCLSLAHMSGQPLAGTAETEEQATESWSKAGSRGFFSLLGSFW